MTIMKIQKGNPYSAPIVITSSDGTPYSLANRRVLFTVKKVSDKRNDDQDAVITKDILPPHTDDVNGIAILVLSASETDVPAGEYKGDIRIYQTGIVQTNSETFTVEIIDIVTKRTN